MNNQEICFINFCPIEILKLIFDFLCYNDIIGFIKSNVVCKLWDKITSELLLNYNDDKKTFKECIFYRDMIGIAYHFMKLNIDRKIYKMHHLIYLFEYVKFKNMNDIALLFYHFDDIFHFAFLRFPYKFHEKKFNDMKEITIKNVEKKAKRKFSWIKASSIKKICILNDSYIKNNMDIITNPFLKPKIICNTILTWLHEKDLLTYERLQKWFDEWYNYVKDHGSDDENWESGIYDKFYECEVVFFLNSLNENYTKELKIFKYYGEYINIPNIYKRYKNDINEIILSHDIDRYLSRDGKNNDLILQLQVKNDKLGFFIAWIEKIEDDMFFEINTIDKFKQWNQYITKFIEFCNNTNFIEKDYFKLIIESKLYKLLKLIIKKRTIPFLKQNEYNINQTLLLKMLLEDSLNDEILNKILI